MRDLAGWELLLGGALLVWVLWRFGRGSVSNLSREKPLSAEQGDAPQNNDWIGLLLPIAAVVLFVLFLIYSLRK